MIYEDGLPEPPALSEMAEFNPAADLQSRADVSPVRNGSTAVDFTVGCEWLGRVQVV
jgi:hypothetical protein